MKKKPNEWFSFAETDLQAAKFLKNMDPIPIGIICYHCEQTAEKMLKGVLFEHDVEPPKTHDLVQLCKQCCEFNKSFELLFFACNDLTRYGVSVRYPSDNEATIDDMNVAIKCAERIYDYVTNLLQLDEDEEETQEFDITM